jgi:hypothetical protein
MKTFKGKQCESLVDMLVQKCERVVETWIQI